MKMILTANEIEELTGYTYENLNIQFKEANGFTDINGVHVNEYIIDEQTLKLLFMRVKELSLVEGESIL